MYKADAVKFISVVGHGTETANHMLKDLPDPFDMEEDVMPDSVYDTIVDGMIEMAYMMSDIKAIVGE